jgi:arylsulfatase A-like enzyme
MLSLPYKIHFNFQIKKISLLFVTALLITVVSTAQKPDREKNEKTNILFLLADDLGWADLGYSGSSFYETPNIDALAKDGMVFTRAYAAASNCSPTRASIMTGKYPVHTGITNYIGSPQPSEWKKNTLLLPAPYSQKLSLDELTIAEALKEGGYDTYFAGKWHLGPEGYWPENQGFDINHGGTELGHPATKGNTKGYFSPYNNARISDGPDSEYLPERLTSETIAYLKGRKQENKPFFVYQSFYLVHSPFMAKKELLEKYEKKRKSLGLGDEYGTSVNIKKFRINQSLPVYAAMVEALDQAVGRIIETLKEEGLYEKTLIIFTSDNGGLATPGPGIIPTSNFPLKAGKGSPYEGGIREPLIVRWPGVTKAGNQSATPVNSVDFYPTLLEFAGVPLHSHQNIDGQSIVPLLRGGKIGERTLFWHFPHYANEGSKPFSIVMQGDYKLIRNYEDNSYELYNVVTDIGESRNLIDSDQKRVKKMKKSLTDFLKESGAKLPTKNQAYKK